MAIEAHIDRETLATLKDVMEDEFQVLIDTFLSDAEQRLTALRDYLGSGDSAGLRSTAHSFKGSCSNIGAPQLARLCARVEQDSANGELGDLAQVLTDIEDEYRVVCAALGEL